MDLLLHLQKKETRRQAINVELLKKPGDYHPEKLHTIKLFHPQFNMNNKIMGREIMELCK
jgi:hypothetical protein